MYTPNFYLISLSVIMPFVPLVLGLKRIKKMDPAFYPFIAVLGCAFIAELFRFFQLWGFYKNLSFGIGVSLIGYNFYILAIALLYSLFFYNLGQFRALPGMLYWIFGFFVLFWVFDHFIVLGYRLHAFTKIFRLGYSFFLCIVAIAHINYLLVHERQLLIRKSSFLICLGILFFYTPYIITEGILLFLKKSSNEFLAAVIFMRQITIILMNSLFLFAVLWIPPKKRFIQLS